MPSYRITRAPPRCSAAAQHDLPMATPVMTTNVALPQRRLRQFLALTKPRVVSLIVFTAVIGMFLAVARTASGAGASLRHAGHRIGRRRGGGDQLPGRAENRCGNGAHARAAAAARRAHVAADAGVRQRRRHCGSARALSDGQRADDVAHPGHVSWATPSSIRCCSSPPRRRTSSSAARRARCRPCWAGPRSPTTSRRKRCCCS